MSSRCSSSSTRASSAAAPSTTPTEDELLRCRWRSTEHRRWRSGFAKQKFAIRKSIMMKNIKYLHAHTNVAMGWAGCVTML